MADLLKLHALPQRTYRSNRHGSILTNNQIKKEKEKPSSDRSSEINRSKFPVISPPGRDAGITHSPSLSNSKDRLRPPPCLSLNEGVGASDRLRPPPCLSLNEGGGASDRLRPPPCLSAKERGDASHHHKLSSSQCKNSVKSSPPSSTSHLQKDRLKPLPLDSYHSETRGLKTPLSTASGSEAMSTCCQELNGTKGDSDVSTRTGGDDKLKRRDVDTKLGREGSGTCAPVPSGECAGPQPANKKFKLSTISWP